MANIRVTILFWLITHSIIMQNAYHNLGGGKIMNNKKTNYFNYSPNLFNSFVNNNPDDLYTPAQALSKGNISKRLYKGYRNYQPVNLNIDNPMTALQAYNFVLTDLELYLDTHPSDESAIRLHNAYTTEYRNLVERFEKLNYPLNLDYINESPKAWKWVNNWQVKGVDK